jgi:hypothetical protein
MMIAGQAHRKIPHLLAAQLPTGIESGD